MSTWHNVQGKPKTQSRRAGWKAKSDFVTRVEHDAKNDAMLQTIRSDIAGIRGDIAQHRLDVTQQISVIKGDVERLNGQIEGVKGHLEGVKTSLNVILAVLALFVGLGLVQFAPLVKVVTDMLTSTTPGVVRLPPPAAGPPASGR
ncbi:MAG: hypothetical protein EOP37_00035 [Rubrivivax sp.]|nr:MAG: hypothetical protein EOP37_00035 [Rubrivivax sp.]